MSLFIGFHSLVFLRCLLQCHVHGKMHAIQGVTSSLLIAHQPSGQLGTEGEGLDVGWREVWRDLNRECGLSTVSTTAHPGVRIALIGETLL